MKLNLWRTTSCVLSRPVPWTPLVAWIMVLVMMSELLFPPLALALTWQYQTPSGGPWKGIEFLTELDGKGYFRLTHSSSNDHVYEFDGSTWTENTPTGGPWKSIGFLTTLGGKWHFRLRDSSANWYVYEFDGSTWTENTPSGGPWKLITFLTELGGKGYFGLRDSSSNWHVYELDNVAPIANAGPDQTTNVNAVVILDGSGSSDDSGDALTYGWTQSGGTPLVVLSGTNNVTATFTTPGAPTILTFTLAVTDSLGLADPTPDEVVITISNFSKTYLPVISK